EWVYRDALPLADRVYLTRVHGEVPGDRAMPDGWLAGFEVTARDDDAGAQGPLRFSFLDYRRAARGACTASRTSVPPRSGPELPGPARPGASSSAPRPPAAPPHRGTR